MSNIRSLRCLGAGLAVLFVGCNAGPELGGVQGTVSMDGEPLPYATVEFYPENGRPSMGYSDHEGHYEMLFTLDREGALLGPQTARVSTFRESGQFTDPEGNPLPAMPDIVHPRFGQESRDNPDMHFDIKPGKNVIDLHVESIRRTPRD